jgi:hypothetical protein
MSYGAGYGASNDLSHGLSYDPSYGTSYSFRNGQSYSSGHNPSKGESNSFSYGCSQDSSLRRHRASGPTPLSSATAVSESPSARLNQNPKAGSSPRSSSGVSLAARQCGLSPDSRIDTSHGLGLKAG